ncbi:hypothetical protein RUM44_010274 [Polyplax serrata]|uniref:Ionotropic glutamate receptor C-terminal domain-containing protein n=1 Tax=Polyplax serrata TaxID=468196 RepID=A0ABR1AV23_POLSC
MREIFRSIILFTVVGVSPTSEHIVKEILEHQISLWCDSRPFAFLYTRGRYVDCMERNRTERKELHEQTLRGVTLKVGILETDHDRDFDCGVTREDGKVTPNEDYTNHILKLLQEVLHFEIVYIPFSSWLRNTNSNGAALMRLLQSNATDLTACHWSISDMVLQSADHLRSTLRTTEAFIFVPNNLPLAQDVFLRTFSFKLWIFFFFTICILIISFKFSTYMHSKVRPDHEPWQWDEAILWAVATVAQQSCRHPRGSSCRTMFLIGYTISYLLYTGFAAGITSLLALSGHRNRLSFDDVTSLRLKLLFHRDEYYFDFLENGFKATSTKSNYLIRSEFDDLSGIFQKISQGRSVGYGGLLKFYETGLLDMGEKRFLKTHEHTKLQKTNPWQSADLGNVFSAIIFLIVGWILSVFVLILEIIFWKRGQRNSKKKILL